MLWDTSKDMLRMTAGLTHETFHLPHWEVIHVKIIPNNISFLLQSFLLLLLLGMQKGSGAEKPCYRAAGYVTCCRHKAGHLRSGPNVRFCQVFNLLTNKTIFPPHLPSFMKYVLENVWEVQRGVEKLDDDGCWYLHTQLETC